LLIPFITTIRIIKVNSNTFSKDFIHFIWRHIMNNSKNIRFIAALALIISLTLASCTASATPVATEASQSTQEIVIGLSLSDLSNPFFISVQDGAQEAADRLGATLIVNDASNDSATQTRQIQAMLDKKVNILLINPVDSDAIGSVIQASNTAGIPVITVDRSASSGEVVSHIASDNIAGGVMAGDYLAELLGKTGNVVELEGIAGTSAAKDRGTGFNEAMAAYGNITIVAHEVAEFDRATAKQVFAKLLAQYPDINGVFAHNDSMILGAMDAAQEAERTGIIFVGFDAVDEAVDAVEKAHSPQRLHNNPQKLGDSV
jgi:ribose transport system substrate-binding protein